MSKVRGSRQYQLEVVPRRARVAWIVAPLFLMALLGAAATAYWWGVSDSRSERLELRRERESREVELRELRQENRNLREDMARLEVSAEMDRKANESVRSEVVELREQIATLETEISFYRGMMAPTEVRRGLSIGSLKLLPTGVARELQFKLVIQQFATSHQLINGSLQFSIVGNKSGEPVTYALKDLSEDIDSVNIKLRFRYFQTIEGTLKLPEGFDPERVELAARSNGDKGQSVARKLEWLVEEH